MKALMRTARALVAAFVVLVSASVAGAQQLCLPRDAAVARLDGQYAEKVFGRGLVQGGRAMIEVFVSKTGTWTVLITDVNGQSCMVAAGENWTQPRLLVGDPV